MGHAHNACGRSTRNRPHVSIVLVACAMTAFGSLTAFAQSTASSARPSTASNANSARNADASMARLLSGRLSFINLDQTPLADVVELLRNDLRMNVYVNWTALEFAGVDRMTPISLKLRNVRMDKLLDLILRQASPDNALSHYLDGNVLHITTRQIADEALVTRVYPVMDLLVEIPDFVGPTFNLDASNEGGSSPFGGSNGQTNQDNNIDQRIEKLIQLIQKTIEPDIWRDNGGVASIRFFMGNLIVTAPRRIHDRVG
jgi:hypothetical protein